MLAFASVGFRLGLRWHSDIILISSILFKLLIETKGNTVYEQYQ